MGCLLCAGALAGLAVQRPTAADDLAQGRAAEARYAWGQALAWYAQAAAYDPHDPAPLAASARLRLAQGRGDRAASDWRRAIALAPRDAALWDLGGDIATANGAMADALRDYELAIDLAPASSAAQHAAERVARVKLAAGAPGDVLAVARRIPQPSPTLAALLAIAQIHLDAVAAAQTLVGEGADAAALTPDVVRLIAGWSGTARDEAALGYADLVAGWPRLALAPLRAALGQQPGYGPGAAYLAWALWQTGDVSAARSALAEAERLVPDAALTVGVAAQLRAAGGDPAGALAALRAWGGGHTLTPALWDVMAGVAEAAGDLATEGDALWHLATDSMGADAAGATLRLAQFTLRTGLGMDAGRAQWAAFAAVADAPQSAAARDLLGQWEWEAGQPAAALAAQAVALRLDPTYAPAHAHRANELWALGDATAARIEAADAVALSADAQTLMRPAALLPASDDSLAV